MSSAEFGVYLWSGFLIFSFIVICVIVYFSKYIDEL